jgi:hypothetical protein
MMQRSGAQAVGAGVGCSVAVGSIWADIVGVNVLVVEDTAVVGGTAVRVEATWDTAFSGVADGSEEAAAGTQPANTSGSKHSIRSKKPADHRQADIGGKRLIPVPSPPAGGVRPGFFLPSQRPAARNHLARPTWTGQPVDPANRGH